MDLRLLVGVISKTGYDPEFVRFAAAYRVDVSGHFPKARGW